MAEVVVTSADYKAAENAGLKIPPGIGPLGGALNGFFDNPFSAPLDAATSVGALITRLLTPGFWVRVGIGWAGWMLILFGVIIMVMSSRVGQQAKANAMKAATVMPQGKVVKAAAVATTASGS